MLSTTIGGPRTIEFLDLLFTRNRIGDPISAFREKTNQPVVAGIIHGALNRRCRVSGPRRVGRIGCLGYVEQSKLKESIAAVELRRKFGGSDLEGQHDRRGEQTHNNERDCSRHPRGSLHR